MNYKASRCYQNCEKKIFDGVGEFDIPEILPEDVNVENVPLIGFNYALTEKHPEDKICHFFVDDYQFERVWNNADMYINVLRKFKAVLSPDFSIYLDFPRIIQLYNHYRNQWCGAYWQDMGIKVIPTVRWGDESTFDWCFDGVPHNSLICISTVGGFKEKAITDVWMKGYEMALKVLEPSKILFYGKLHNIIPKPDCPYVCAVNQNTLNRKLARERMDAEAKISRICV